MSNRQQRGPAEGAYTPRPVSRKSGSQLSSARPAALAVAQMATRIQDRASAPLAAESARPNRTGLPDALKAGIETLSGVALDDVRVHRNSSRPAQLQALAYARGSDIHLGPGQERHLAHEAWHIVQQKQGRVSPTMQRGGVAINDDTVLEREADSMGARALAHWSSRDATPIVAPSQRTATADVAQCILIKVTTRKEMFKRVVDKVQFAERVPTTASSGQGDHTVAEALVELALEKHCLNKTHQEIADTLPNMLFHLDGEVSAKYLGEDNKYHKADIKTILPMIEKYRHNAYNGADGEDLNEALSYIIEMYLRVWNKRAGSAYVRSEGMTTGGSGGSDEKKAKKDLSELSNRNDLDLEPDDEGLGWKLTAARALTKFIDFNAPKDLDQAAEHLKTAINLTVELLEDGDQHYEHIGTIAVQLFSRMHGLNAKQEEELDSKTFFLLNGETYDDFEDTEMK